MTSQQLKTNGIYPLLNLHFAIGYYDDDKIEISIYFLQELFPLQQANWYSLFGDFENRENNYLNIRDLLSIALFNILCTHYLIHI